MWIPLRVLWSIWVWLWIAVFTIVAGTVAVLAGTLLRPIDRNRRLGQLASTVWGHACFLANPLWRLEVEGKERMTRAGPAVICANHSSQVDILAISALHGQWRWVSKSEIFWFPFLGWGMKAIGSPFVRRGDKESGKKMLEHCRWWLDRGVSILIFPEGTRTEDGALQPFKPGAFKLALESGRPVLPVVVKGSAAALAKKSLDMSRRAHVTVSVLEPVDVTPWKSAFDVEGLCAHVRTLMAEEVGRG